MYSSELKIQLVSMGSTGRMVTIQGVENICRIYIVSRARISKDMMYDDVVCVWREKIKQVSVLRFA